jgi:hypothetical protein
MRSEGFGHTAQICAPRRCPRHECSTISINTSDIRHQYISTVLKSPLTAPPAAQAPDGCELTYCPLRAIPRNFISDLAALCQPAGSPYLAVACSLAPDPHSHLSLADTGKCAIEICSQSVEPKTLRSRPTWPRPSRRLQRHPSQQPPR